MNEELIQSIYAALIVLSESSSGSDMIILRKTGADAAIACVESHGVPVSCERGIDKACPFGAALVKLAKKLVGARR